MSYDVLFSLRGDKTVSRWFATVKTEKQAFAAARRMFKKNPDLIHGAITCEDGRTIINSQDGGSVAWITG